MIKAIICIDNEGVRDLAKGVDAEFKEGLSHALSQTVFGAVIFDDITFKEFSAPLDERVNLKLSDFKDIEEVMNLYAYQLEGLDLTIMGTADTIAKFKNYISNIVMVYVNVNNLDSINLKSIGFNQRNSTFVHQVIYDNYILEYFEVKHGS